MTIAETSPSHTTPLSTNRWTITPSQIPNGPTHQLYTPTSPNLLRFGMANTWATKILKNQKIKKVKKFQEKRKKKNHI